MPGVTGRNGYFLPLTLEPGKAAWFNGEIVSLHQKGPGDLHSVG